MKFFIVRSPQTKNLMEHRSYPALAIVEIGLLPSFEKPAVFPNSFRSLLRFKRGRHTIASRLVNSSSCHSLVSLEFVGKWSYFIASKLRKSAQGRTL
jgi:hypothetical protein